MDMIPDVMCSPFIDYYQSINKLQWKEKEKRKHSFYRISNQNIPSFSHDNKLGWCNDATIRQISS